MPVDTKNVAGRRTVRYEAVGDIVADAQRLAAAPAHTLGNWSLGQVFSHLARSLNLSVDGTDYRPPWLVRFLVGFMKRSMLTRTMSAGFQLPPAMAAILLPPETSVADGLSQLCAAAARFQQAPELKPHTVFGPMTRDEWEQFHCRHAELHMSFAVLP